MAVRKKEEILAELKNRIGDSTDDETLAFLEDVTDTLSDLEEKSGEDWHARFVENDKMWRDKYKARFFSAQVEEVPAEEEEEEAKKTFEDLFA